VSWFPGSSFVSLTCTKAHSGPAALKAEIGDGWLAEGRVDRRQMLHRHLKMFIATSRRNGYRVYSSLGCLSDVSNVRIAYSQIKKGSTIMNDFLQVSNGRGLSKVTMPVSGWRDWIKLKDLWGEPVSNPVSPDSEPINCDFRISSSKISANGFKVVWYSYTSKYEPFRKKHINFVSCQQWQAKWHPKSN